MSVADREAPALVDRRRPVTGVRTSWASSSPFVPATSTDVPSQPVPRPGGADAALRTVLPRSAWERGLLRTVVLSDVVSAGVVAAVTAASSGTGLVTGVLLTVLAAVVWSGALLMHGAYRARHLESGPEEFQAVMRVAVTLVAPLGVAAYASQTLLVVGTPAQVAPVAADRAREPFHGYDVVGICQPSLTRSSTIHSRGATTRTASRAARWSVPGLSACVRSREGITITSSSSGIYSSAGERGDQGAAGPPEKDQTLRETTPSTRTAAHPG